MKGGKCGREKEECGGGMEGGECRTEGGREEHQWRIYDLIKGVSRVNSHARPLSPGNPTHSLIEELLEVNEMQVV